MSKNIKIGETDLNRDFQYLKVLIERCKNNDEAACKTLYKYFDRVVNRWVKIGVVILGENHLDDLKSIAYWSIFTGTRHFNGDNTPQYFKYVHKIIIGKIKNYINKEKSHLKQCSSDYNHSYIKEAIPDSYNLEKHCIRNLILEHVYYILNEKERNLYNLIYMNKMSYKDIPRHLSISDDCFRQRKKRMHDKIKNAMKNKGITVIFDLV